MGRIFTIQFSDLSFPEQQEMIDEIKVDEVEKLKAEAEFNRVKYPKAKCFEVTGEPLYENADYRFILKDLYDLDGNSMAELDRDIETLAEDLAEQRCNTNFGAMRVEI